MGFEKPKVKTTPTENQAKAIKRAEKAAEEPTQGFSILLAKSTHKKLKLLAIERETSVSELIREAVDQTYMQ